MWYYNSFPYTKIHDSQYIGFVYKITEISTGRIYIGMKNFLSTTTKKLGKKALALITDKRLSKKIRSTNESNWKTYNSSSKTLQELIKQNPDNYYKEIISFHKSKKQLAYAELKQLILNDVLLSPNFINDYIGVGKFFRRDFI